MSAGIHPSAVGIAERLFRDEPSHEVLEQLDAVVESALADVQCPPDCADALVDEVCGVLICADHSDEFTTCAASTVRLHHLGCVDWCEDCQAVAGQDHFEGGW